MQEIRAGNFHDVDPDESYCLGRFPTWQKPVTAAREVEEDFLKSNDKPGVTAEGLYGQYTSFGEEKDIVPTLVEEKFSGWDYAKL